MTLDIPRVRPRLFTKSTIVLLDPFLAFRHRFRNLYLFDLKSGLVDQLLETAPQAWAPARDEIETFCDRIEALATQMENA